MLVPFDPCGMVVDYLPRCYTTKMKMWQGEDTTCEVRWYRCEPGAKELPQRSPFRARAYYWTGEGDPDLGEVLTPQQTGYDKGANPLRFAGQHYCGDLTSFMAGGVRGVSKTLTVVEGGGTDCCRGSPPCGPVAMSYEKKGDGYIVTLATPTLFREAGLYGEPIEGWNAPLWASFKRWFDSLAKPGSVASAGDGNHWRIPGFYVMTSDLASYSVPIVDDQDRVYIRDKLRTTSILFTGYTGWNFATDFQGLNEGAYDLIKEWINAGGILLIVSTWGRMRVGVPDANWVLEAMNATQRFSIIDHGRTPRFYAPWRTYALSHQQPAGSGSSGQWIATDGPNENPPYPATSGPLAPTGQYWTPFYRWFGGYPADNLLALETHFEVWRTGGTLSATSYFIRDDTGHDWFVFRSGDIPSTQTVLSWGSPTSYPPGWANLRAPTLGFFAAFKDDGGAVVHLRRMWADAWYGLHELVGLDVPCVNIGCDVLGDDPAPRDDTYIHRGQPITGGTWIVSWDEGYRQRSRGGPVLGGHSPWVTGYASLMRGGPVLGGTCNQGLVTHYSQGSAGGPVLGGESVQGWGPGFFGAGGPVLGGHSVQAGGYTQRGIGGPVLGGPGLQGIPTYQVGSGGPVLGGVSPQWGSEYGIGEGGPVLGGSSPQEWTP